MTLLQFVQSCRTPKKAVEAPVFRIKQVDIIVRPPDPMGPKYKQYYRQKHHFCNWLDIITQVLYQHGQQGYPSHQLPQDLTTS